MHTLNMLAFRFLADRRGVTAIEYAILAGAVVVGLLAVFGTGASGTGTVFASLKTKLTSIITLIPSTAATP
jgi:pilus assembly protein Flp/PilA